MERGSLVRWVFMGLAVVLFMQFGLPLLTGESNGPSTRQALPADHTTPPADPPRPEPGRCELGGDDLRFKATLSSRGGVLEHVRILGEKYLSGGNGERQPIELVTTSREPVMPLRTDLHAVSGTDQVPYHNLDWKLEAQTPTSCSFVYEDAAAHVTKTVSTTGRPFELKVELAVQNKAAEPRTHRLAVEQTDWRTQKDVAGSWGSVSEALTKVEVRAGGETERFEPGDFDADELDEPEFTDEKWRRAPGDAQWAAVSSSYFSKAVFHVQGPAAPAAETRIEEVWRHEEFANKSKDPQYGHVYRARLAYPAKELGPNETASYSVLAFVGPKEREVLAHFGGEGMAATELLDLGMFGAIGELLIGYLYVLFGLTKTWGWAICLLTITVKLVLFPLSISQIKSSMAMRKLKPQMDEINERYKDDAQQRGVAIQELWRKNNVTNPVLGCLPVMLQMPIWFALYTALQTAVELYHTPFGPFIPDLSAPGLYYIIPLVLGASSFFQQRLMPMQGDAMQQKMMKYMMPLIFTVMMLFLPAGLGIYFLTNTWLSIAQQVAVERYYKSAASSDGEKKTTEAGDDEVEARA